MYRGDDKTYIICAQTPDGSARPFEDGDTVYFTVRKRQSDRALVLQKIMTSFDENGAAILQIAYEDTKELYPTDYLYDVQLTDKQGKRHTIVGTNTFRLLEDQTYE